jgi:hypothetical protein
MIRLIFYPFAVALVMLLYVAAYFIALKPLPVRPISPVRSGAPVRPGPTQLANHRQPHRTAAYKIPFFRPAALPAGFWPAFFAPVQYADAHWIRPGYWGTPPDGHP